MKIYKFEEFKVLILSKKIKCLYLEEFETNVLNRYKTKIYLKDIGIDETGFYMEFIYNNLISKENFDFKNDAPNKFTCSVKLIENCVGCRIVEFNNIKELIWALSKGNVNE